jgi:hypothetical protein
LFAARIGAGAKHVSNSAFKKCNPYCLYDLNFQASAPALSASMRHADVLLRAAERGDGVSVYPEAGKLVIFFTRGDDGHVDPISFHGGAAVGVKDSSLKGANSKSEGIQGQAGQSATRPCGGGDGGDGKWMIQVCKEVPYRMRGAAAMASFVKARRDFAKQHCL